MKKLAVAVLVLALAIGLAWQNRVNLLVWALPKVQGIVNPVAPNRPVEWQAGPAQATAGKQRPPNIILILADDLGFNDISLHNGGAADGTLKTPNIDALAQEGVTFSAGYAANAVCAPSRASIMTGRYSTRFGFEFTPFPKIGATIFRWMDELNPSPLPLFIDQQAAEAMPPMAAQGLPAEEVTIAEVLKARGYYTAHIGKWHLGTNDGFHPTDQGFDDSLNMEGLLFAKEGTPGIISAKVDHQIDRMVWARGGFSASFNKSEPFEPADYLTDYYTDEAVKVIERNRHRPFFLYLAHWAVHNPLQATQARYEELAHIEDKNLRIYAAMIRSLDESVGRVLTALEAHGLTDNTLVVFTSDNGGAGYIGLPNINKPFRGWKLNHFEGGLRVPFLARWPEKIPAGHQVDDPVHHVDLFTTLAAAAGAEIPQDRKLDGVDLIPYARGRKSRAPHQTLFWREGHQQTVWHDGWKLIRADRPDKRWLFNLADDATEQRNLADANPERLAQLEALLDAHNAEQAKPSRPSVVNSPQLIDKHHLLPYEEGDEYIYWPN